MCLMVTNPAASFRTYVEQCSFDNTSGTFYQGGFQVVSPVYSTSLHFVRPFPFFLSLLRLLRRELYVLFLSSSVFCPGSPS